MNRIIAILLSIIVLQVLALSYIKFTDEKKEPTQNTISSVQPYVDAQLETLVHNSIQEIMQEAKKLPQSKQYTEWDKQTLTNVHNELLTQERIEKSKAKAPHIALVETTQKNQKINTIQKEIQLLVAGALHQTNMKTIKTCTSTVMAPKKSTHKSLKR